MLWRNSEKEKKRTQSRLAMGSLFTRTPLNNFAIFRFSAQTTAIISSVM